MAEAKGKFDPKDHITSLPRKKKVDGVWVEVPSDYLEVKWRIAWFRDEHPDGDMDTELVDRTPDFALYRAKVTIPGGGSATGWGSETKADFGDFIEKAETKAQGRALAALGYGTQFCTDFDEGGAVADAPVARGPQSYDGYRQAAPPLEPITAPPVAELRKKAAELLGQRFKGQPGEFRAYLEKYAANTLSEKGYEPKLLTRDQCQAIILDCEVANAAPGPQEPAPEAEESEAPY